MRLGNLEPFVPEGTALSEHTQLGIVLGETGTGVHGGQGTKAEALMAPRPVEERYSLSVAGNRLTIVALSPVGSAEGMVRQPLQDAIPASRGEPKGALAGGDGLVIGAHGREMQ